MTTRPYNVISEFWRRDRKRSVVITERGGIFSFHEEGEETDLGAVYWTTLSGGGFYASADEAERAARSETPWVRDEGAV